MPNVIIDHELRINKDICSKKVFLILDNLKVHHAKPVTRWLAEYVGEIEVFYLLSYSPELNSDQMFNTALKANVTKQAPATDRGAFQKSVHQLSTSSLEITTTCRLLFHVRINLLCSLSKFSYF
ncbi:MAG: hypothetical protein E5299_01402 [Burkholderia gladioli]|nr:MAG: hypothetical protein E5299_01402 [Burkholderia gladioli]